MVLESDTLNFAVRRPRTAGLTCAARTLTAAEIELRCRRAFASASSECEAHG